MVERQSIPVHVRRRAVTAGERPRGLPHVYAGGSRGGRKARFDTESPFAASSGRFRWLISTVLVGTIGAVAILVVIYGSTDRIEQSGTKTAWTRMLEGKIENALVVHRDEGLKWSAPKGDLLQMTSGASSTRFTIHDPIRVKKANREYILAKHYARIVSHLAPAANDFSDVIPPFNPFKLYATDNGASDRPAAGASSTASDVSVKVVELLGGILPSDDGQELDAQEIVDLVARSRDAVADPDAVAADGAPTANAPSTQQADAAGRARSADAPLPPATSNLVKSVFESDEPAADLEQKQVRIVKVGKVDTLVRILQQAGTDAWQAKAMAETAKGFIPDGMVTPGQEVRITMVPSLTQAGRMEPSRFSVFTDGQEHKVTILRNSAGDFVASPTPFEETAVSEAAASGEQSRLASLYSSFYAAGLAQHIPSDTIMQMLRIHAFATDFGRRVRPSDTIEMFFDMREDSAPDSAPGELLYTAITTGGVSGRFWRFRSSDGVVDFYDEQGNNSKRFLMRKPLRSDDVRLTSGFGMRWHPLFNDRRMHTGIDWSGSIGTPIVAAGSGVVEEILYKGGNGRYIRIRHANGYQTAYSHMSAFARGLEPGSKVRQGQVIGFLGSTGYATGPHLHFEILVNNRFVDPLSIQVPREHQLTGKDLADFQKERSRIDELMRRPPVMTQTR